MLITATTTRARKSDCYTNLVSWSDAPEVYSHVQWLRKWWGIELALIDSMDPRAQTVSTDAELVAAADGRYCVVGLEPGKTWLCTSVFTVADVDRYRIRDLVMHIRNELLARPAQCGAPVPLHPQFPHIVGTAPAMVEMTKFLAKVARSESTVLIHGESGTGKELVARALHYGGPRAHQAFIVQNCSAFNDNLLESALFGHVKGSFTGAVKDQKGLFEAADKGTFFLDEIGDMSPALQVKLLRVLQEGTFTPVGGTKPVKVDVRIVAATHKNLAEMASKKQFREDLFYRVNVVALTLPPLRERKSDIPMLISHFLRKHGGPTPASITTRALDALVAFAWPGNIRELENELERATVLCAGRRIDIDDLSPRIGAAARAPIAAPPPLPEQIRALEAERIASALVRLGWDIGAVASELGLSHAAVVAKCAEYRIAYA